MFIFLISERKGIGVELADAAYYANWLSLVYIKK